MFDQEGLVGGYSHFRRRFLFRLLITDVVNSLNKNRGTVLDLMNTKTIYPVVQEVHLAQFIL